MGRGGWRLGAAAPTYCTVYPGSSALKPQVPNECAVRTPRRHPCTRRPRPGRTYFESRALNGVVKPTFPVKVTPSGEERVHFFTRRRRNQGRATFRLAGQIVIMKQSSLSAIYGSGLRLGVHVELICSCRLDIFGCKKRHRSKWQIRREMFG